MNQDAIDPSETSQPAKAPADQIVILILRVGDEWRALQGESSQKWRNLQRGFSGFGRCPETALEALLSDDDGSKTELTGGYVVRIFIAGSKWCALQAERFEAEEGEYCWTGVAGFGESPQAALRAFLENEDGPDIPALPIDSDHQRQKYADRYAAECGQLRSQLNQWHSTANLIAERLGLEWSKDMPFSTLVLSAFERLQGVEWQKIEEILKNHEATQPVVWRDSLANRVAKILGQYRSSEAEAKDALANFRQDVQNYLRALVIVIESATTHGTHHEKNVRLGGVIAQIESAISKLRDNFKHFDCGWGSNPDIFRSDFPVRRYVDRIKELEREVNDLKSTDQKQSSPKQIPSEPPF